MMKILRFLLNIIGVFFAALVGNWIGERWRSVDTGEAGHELALVHSGEDGDFTIAVNPVMTNFLPAVLVGLLSRPASWVMAFVTGVLTARFMGDQYEEQFDELLRGLMPGGEPTEIPES